MVHSNRFAAAELTKERQFDLILSDISMPNRTGLQLLAPVKERSPLSLRRWGQPALTLLTGLLLWTAAAGGTLFLLVNLSVGVTGGWLWVSVPLAWIALWAWRRRRRRRPFPLDTP